MNPFDEMYAGTPPWEIGRPQPAIVALVERGLVSGRVLDAGCGTGENALYAASRGCQVTGIDAAPRAIARAVEKARERGIEAAFLEHDALDLASLGETFDCVIDSGLFHAFNDEGRARYVKSLADAVHAGGRVFVLCFSEEEPDWGGPRRITQAELRQAFGPPFLVERIEPARFENRLTDEGSRAWLATIFRAQDPDRLH